MKYVSKEWGYELWIANSDLYCGKLLHVVKGKKCSVHFHKLKDETFYVYSGSLDVWYADNEDFEDIYDPESPLSDYVGWWNVHMGLCVQHKKLYAGDSLHLPPYTPHQFRAKETTELFEFSTQHFDEDSYRIIKGG